MDNFRHITVQQLADDDGGGFVAYVDGMLGCVGEGDTPEAAIADAQRAIVEWLDEAQRLGRIIP